MVARRNKSQLSLLDVGVDEGVKKAHPRRHEAEAAKVRETTPQTTLPREGTASVEAALSREGAATAPTTHSRGAVLLGLSSALEALAHGDVWLVCRGRATARAVLVSLARQNPQASASWAGLRVTTLGALLAEAAGRSLLPAADDSSAPALPSGHPWSAKLATRPGLRRLLRSHLEQLHALRAADASAEGTRPEIAALLREGWGRTSRVDAAARLLRRVPERTRLFAAGFAPEPFSFAGQVGRFERVLLSALKAEPLHASNVPERLPSKSLHTYVVADPHAEVRAIARHALGRDDVLVLVPDEATASRARAALSRNGIAVADRGFSSLKQHALVALLRPLVPLCGSRGEEAVDHEALLHLLLSPVLSRRALAIPEAPVVEDPFAYEEEFPTEPDEPLPEEERPRLSLRHAKELLLRCRRLRATLPEWRDRLRGEAFELTGKESASDNEAQRKALRSRLDSAQVLIDRLELLLDCSREGTLAGLARFVRTVGLSEPQSDRLARAIVHALHQAGRAAATEESFDEALSGALASSRLDEGVEVLPYEEYDGRRCGLLLCAGVHDKGLSRASAPDPFLTEPDYAVLGLTQGQARVKERLSLLRWAVSNAEESFAFSPRRDASGRRVTLPAELADEVALDSTERFVAYGLPGPEEVSTGTFALPELADLGALASSEGVATPSDEDVCEQTDAEWVRAGWRIHGRTREDAPTPRAHETPVPLSMLLEESDPLLPDTLRPYLGEVGGPALPEKFTLSATRLADFTQCLFRAFLAHALRLKAPEDVEEEYTPSELGDFMHDALAEAMRGMRWVVPAAEVEGTRNKVLESLCLATERRFAKEDAALGSDVSPAILAARSGVLDRWKKHWARYLDARVVSVEAHNTDVFRSAIKRFERGPDFEAALDALGLAQFTSAAAQKRLKKSLSDGLVSSGGNLEAALASGALLDELKDSSRGFSERGCVEARLEQPETRALLSALFSRFRSMVEAQLAPPEGDEQVVEVELPFGAAEHSRGVPSTLRLGAVEVPVQGRIDAVVLARGQRVGGGSYHVVDYKTGGKDQTSRPDIDALTHPQLPFYGLALRERLAQAPEPLEALPISQVAYDAVKDRPVRVTLARGQLDAAAQSFGALLERAQEGRFTLQPHPLRCPLIDPKKRCDFAEVCRFRESFADEGDVSEAGDE